MSDEQQKEKRAVRDASGRFLPGAPAGPGRARGLSHSEKVRMLLEPHREVLIGRALALTKSDDPFAAANALRICLERLAPAPKQEPEKVEVPGLAEAATLTEKCHAIIAAVAEGAISAEAGERLLRMLDVYRRAVTHDALEARVAALEGKRVIETEHTDDAEDIA